MVNSNTLLHCFTIVLCITIVKTEHPNRKDYFDPFDLQFENSTLPQLSLFAETIIYQMTNITRLLELKNQTRNYTEDKRTLYEMHSNGSLKIDHQEFQTMEEICNYNGFKLEKHQVVTDDDYILSLWRIPGTFEESPTHTKPPILLMHGLGYDATQWVFNSPDVAPAFVLSRKGYDVWLGNSRGTSHS
jgi:hypothetical protein